MKQRLSVGKAELHRTAGPARPAEISIAVTAKSRATMDRDLDAAVDVAMTEALRHARQGILVIRHGPHSFTVSLSDAVPFGQTRERQDW